MGKAKQNAGSSSGQVSTDRKKAMKKNKWQHVTRRVLKKGAASGGSAVAAAAGAAAGPSKSVQQNGKRRPEIHVEPRRKIQRTVEMQHNGHNNPGMFVRVNNQVSEDDDDDDDDDDDTESEPEVANPAPKRRRVEVPVAPPPPEEPKSNVPMYKIIRNGQVHRILVDPDRPGPSKEYEPLNALVRNEMTLSDMSDECEDFSEEMSDEELSEEEYEENYSDEVETGDSEHELDEELLRRMHGGYSSDENEYGSETEDSVFRSDFDTDEEKEYYRRFMQYNESSDTDYDPGEDYIEDLYIPKGAAKTYSVDVMSLPFSPDDNEPRVVDVTEYFEQVRAKNEDAEKESGEESDEPEANGMDSSETSSSPAQTSILIESDTTPEESEESSSDDEDTETLEDFKLFDVGKSGRKVLLLKRAIFINGVLDVQLLAGHAQVNGYELKKNVKKRVVSAKGYKYTNITPLTVTGSQNGAINEDFLRDLPDMEQIRKEFDSHRHALLILSKSKQTPSLRVVKKYTHRHLFPDTAKLLTEPQCKRPLILPEQWTGIEVDDEKSRVMVIGGKNVGKSTLVEHLLNKSLNKREKILLIDLDIGQPILLIPQVVSAAVITEPILGVGTFNQADEMHESKSFLFGDINVMLSPVRYLKCVKKLIAYCVEHYNDLPWVINTMGFHKGLGMELMVGLIKLLQPTAVIQIQHTIENFNFKSLLSADFVNNYVFNILVDDLKAEPAVEYRHQVLDCVLKVDDKQPESGLSPTEKRTIMVLAHLGSILKDHHEWFTDVQPIVCSTDDITIKVIEATNLQDTTDLSLINGNLVYLCHHSKDCDIGECLGLGIVRAASTTKIFLLPAIQDKDQLQKVNTLVVANITLPVDVILRQSTKVTGTIPYVYNTENEFIGSRKVNRCVERNAAARGGHKSKQ